jgi:hypothetical protein
MVLVLWAEQMRGGIMFRAFQLVVVAALAACLAACGGAAPAGSADNAIILTVTGEIGATNRGPLDEFQDVFLGHKGVKFDKAFEFSRASLNALGEQEVQIKRANWPALVTLRGPRLKDVLAAVKAQGNTVVLTALDGYESKFPVSGLRSDKVLLATEADGKPLSIGGHGPVWLVFPEGAVPGDDTSGDAGLAWSIYHIAVVTE